MQKCLIFDQNNWFCLSKDYEIENQTRDHSQIYEVSDPPPPIGNTTIPLPLFPGITPIQILFLP